MNSAVSQNGLRIVCMVSMLALAALCIAWEIWLAPIRPGAWMLAIKALPVIVSLPGIWRHHLRTYQWWSMLILMYFCEGAVRAYSDTGVSAGLAGIETALSFIIFTAVLLYCRQELIDRGLSRRKS